MVNIHTVNTTRPSRIVKFSPCPQCGHKGLYRVNGQYCRCRYCGIYLISPPGQDSEENLALPASFREGSTVR